MTPADAAADGGVAELSGPGWSGWRGVWTSERLLAGRAGGFVLLDGGRERARWGCLGAALEALWRERRVRDGRPWAVGWLSYEAAARLAGGLPHRPPDDPSGALLIEPRGPGPGVTGLDPAPPSPASAVTIRASLDDEAFEAGVGRIRELIGAGRVYQVNLTRRFTVSGWRAGVAPLREVVGEPAPDYLARIRAEGVDLLCASMELLLRRRGRRVSTRPIKGTRPRGATDAEDRALAAALAADPKERAELAMIVDLERNDLGTVAAPGSVEVVDPGSVVSYATVHHRVATVGADVDPDLPWWRLIAAVAPGGSVTGCPKRAAMAVVEELEPVARGPFTGVLGVVAGSGDLELALPIRTAWATAGRLEFAAGCGIVWQSDPRAEEAESRLKVSRWLALVGGGR